MLFGLKGVGEARKMKGRIKEGNGRDVNYILGSNFDEF